MTTMGPEPIGPHLALPESAREAMRAPLGPVMLEGELERHLEGASVMVAVGDVVTATLLEGGRAISIAVFDFKTRRDEMSDFRERFRALKGRRVKVRSPPAAITRELVDALRAAFEEVKGGGSVSIEVEGEEDLATLPAVLLAPDGARVLYGLPGQGMVVVSVDPRSRRKARALLDLLEPREGWTDI